MDDEAAEIELLEQNLHKTRQTSQRMIALLNTFDTRLAKLEKTILPLYDSTQILNRRAENIEKALGKIEEIAINREGIAAEEALILRGPQPGQLEVYTDALSRLNTSIAFTETDRDVIDTARLLETGTKKVCQLYTKLVAEGSSASQASDSTTFPSRLMASVSPIVAFLRTMPIPATHPTHPASSAIFSTLKEALRGFADMRGNWIKLCLDTPAKRFLDRVEKDGGADGVAGGREYSRWVDNLLSSALAEHTLLQNLSPLQPTTTIMTSTYTTLVAPVLSNFSSTTTSLVAIIKRSLHTYSFLALSSYEALLSHQSRFDQIFEYRGENSSGGRELKEGIQVLRGICHRSFPEFLADVKLAANPAPGKGLANDTSVEVCDITISTIQYLERLPSVQGAAAAALLALGDGNWKMGEGVQVGKGPKLGDGDEQIILEHFVYDIINTLLSTLTTLSKTTKREPFNSMFLLNNVSYVRFHLISAALSAYGGTTATASSLLSRPTKELINSSFRTSKAAYFDSNYSVLIQTLTDTSTSSSKVKDKFTRFFDLLEEVVERHKLVNSSSGGAGVMGEDEGERESLADEVVKLVGMSLRGFVAKWSTSLGKNPQKYIKMSAETVEAQLREVYR